VFHHFRKLIKLRHDHSLIVHGHFELLLPDHEQIWAVTRTLDDQRLVMIANCSSEPASVPADALPELTGAQLLLATHGDSTALELAPWESRIHLLG
jgi:oligo-1,6-glucosidase